MKTLLKLLVKKSLWLTGIILLLLSTATTSANAQRIIASYQARLGEADHYNTEGVRLWTIPGIIRQDRANFHYYGPQDYEDEWDGLYDDPNNRATLERMLLHENFSNYEREIIIYGNPLVQVTVFPNHVELSIIQE